EEAGQLLGSRVGAVGLDAVVLHGASHMNAGWKDSQLAKSIRIIFGLSGDQVDGTQKAAGEPTHLLIAPEASWTEPAVDDRHGHTAIPGSRQEVRPQFSFR